MKFLPESPSRLLFLLLLVELPVLAMSHPTPVRHHKDGLTKLLQRMRRLKTLVEGVVHLDTSLPFEHNLTSLPTLNFRPSDLMSVKENSTLSQLSSGLHSFKLHFDWLLYWDDQPGLESDKIKEIADGIHQSVSILEQRQTESPVLALPPLTYAWERYRTAAVIHQRLLAFCDWYLRALRVIIRAKKT